MKTLKVMTIAQHTDLGNRLAEAAKLLRAIGDDYAAVAPSSLVNRIFAAALKIEQARVQGDEQFTNDDSENYTDTAYYPERAQ